jgi:nucleotide-binding universal stress UspA family protein
MVVNPTARPAHPRIAGAINASAEEPVEQALNARIVELTMLMARLEQRSPTLLQAWEPFAEQVVHDHSPPETFLSYVDDARRRATEALGTLTASFGDRLADVEVTLRKGRPDVVIPEFVVGEGVDLVVMGSVARSGLAGVLIGNTAERLLRKLPCSVIAIKPDGFVSPVHLEGAV